MLAPAPSPVRLLVVPSWLWSQLRLCLFPQSIVTLDGGKLVHVQKWNGQETTLVRELSDGKLILVRGATTMPSSVQGLPGVQRN